MMHGNESPMIVDGKSSATSNKPCQVFKVADDNQILSMCAYKNLLLVGTMTKVTAYTWTKNVIGKQLWEVKLSGSRRTALERSEVNCMWLDTVAATLYIGCGDNVVYAICLQNGTVVREFVGHTDFVHSVHGATAGQRLYSASEDGTVRFWDARERRSTGSIEPYRNDKLQRPELGKWQGTVTATDDWLICGGGPRFSLWHLRSLECTTVYSFAGAAHVSGILDDVVFVAGDHPHLMQYSLNGDLTAEVPVSPVSVYSVVWQQEPTKFMAIAGSSNNIDLCTSFNYKDSVISLYKSSKK